jgi:hypothetical protein
MESRCVRAPCGSLNSAKLEVSTSTHTFGVMLSIAVWTGCIQRIFVVNSHQLTITIKALSRLLFILIYWKLREGVGLRPLIRIRLFKEAMHIREDCQIKVFSWFTHLLLFQSNVLIRGNQAVNSITGSICSCWKNGLHFQSLLWDKIARLYGFFAFTFPTLSMSTRD